jgi:hypothetical protein
VGIGGYLLWRQFQGATIDARVDDLERAIRAESARIDELQKKLDGTAEPEQRRPLVEAIGKNLITIRLQLQDERNLLRDRMAIAGVHAGDHERLERLDAREQRVMAEYDFLLAEESAREHKREVQRMIEEQRRRNSEP